MSSIEEYRRRIASVEKIMDKYGVEAILLNRRTNIKYLTGANNTCSWVLFTKSGRQVAMVLESDYLDYMQQTILTDVRVHRPHDPSPLMRKVRDELGLGSNSVAAETEHLTHSYYEMIHGLLSDALNQSVCADKIVEEARMVKTPDELELVRTSASLGFFGLKVAKENITPGITELELERRIYYALLEKGAEQSTFIYVASDGRSSLSHTPATKNKLVNGPVIVDIHANYQGYYTDIARTYFLSNDGEQKEAYDFFVSVIQSTMDYVRAGVTLPDVRRYFHQTFKLKDDWIPLLGPVLHGVGICRPELPRFAHPWEGPGYPIGYKLEPNVTMACSNIGLYSKKGWGIRYEDTFIVADMKPIVFSQ